MAERNILPCKEYVVCEKKGTCPIDDDMAGEIYGLLRQAEVVVLATPDLLLQHDLPAQGPGGPLPGLLGAQVPVEAERPPESDAPRVSAQRRRPPAGKTLFDGLQLTAKYFFDAIDARFDGSLVYRGIEGPKDMANHPTVTGGRGAGGGSPHGPLCRTEEGAVPLPRECLPQPDGGRLCAAPGRRTGWMCPPAAASRPNRSIPTWRRSWPRRRSTWRSARRRASTRRWPAAQPMRSSPWAAAKNARWSPGPCDEDWDLPDPAGQPIEVMRQVRDEIEARVKQLIAALVP
ncbi:MAG: hypothetical protein MZV70_68265 [Desulfobacterales bacterium]|nr:hypothetical protein [Desulfobacterales bacterium]